MYGRKSASFLKPEWYPYLEDPRHCVNDQGVAIRFGSRSNNRNARLKYRYQNKNQPITSSIGPLPPRPQGHPSLIMQLNDAQPPQFCPSCADVDPATLPWQLTALSNSIGRHPAATLMQLRCVGYLLGNFDNPMNERMRNRVCPQALPRTANDTNTLRPTWLHWCSSAGLVLSVVGQYGKRQVLRL